jgi:glycosyltransferase involved in cell wall biosynthesis
MVIPVRPPQRSGPPEAAPAGSICVAIAFPGGFEFGGIGRMMLYATRAWAALPGAPQWRVLDGRGVGPIALMPFHLTAVIATVLAARLAGRLDLLHLNVAGRTSTVRKILLSELAAVLGLPTIVHLHDYDYRSDLQRRSAFRRRLTARMFQRARRVIVLGERDRAIVEDVLDVASRHVVRLANAVPDPGEPPQRAAGSNPIRLLFLGHLDNRKGVPELLRALAQPALRQRAWHLDLAGGGEVARFRSEAQELGLADRTTFHGWLSPEGVAALCRQADVFTLPSHAEGQAMSLLEAMAHGLAIVTTPVGAHLEAVSPGREALIIPPGDVEALAAEIVRLIDEPPLRAQLGGAARRRFLAAFEINDYARDLARLYVTVLGESADASAWQPRAVGRALKGEIRSSTAKSPASTVR